MPQKALILVEDGSGAFVLHATLGTTQDDALSARIAALSASEHPTLRLEVDDPLSLGAEMLRWEIEVSGVREELALVMPHLVRGDAGASTVGGRGKTRASRTSRTKGAAGSKGLRD